MNTNLTALSLTGIALIFLMASASSLELNNYTTSFVTGVTGIIAVIKATQIWDQLEEENK